MAKDVDKEKAKLEKKSLKEKEKKDRKVGNIKVKITRKKRGKKELPYQPSDRKVDGVIDIEASADDDKIRDGSKRSVLEGVFSRLHKMRKIWVTKDIAAKLGREFELKIILRDIVLFAVFLTLASVVCFNNITKYHYYLTRALKYQFKADELEVIHSAEEFWEYLEVKFLPNLYTDTWYGESGEQITNPDDRKIMHENLLIGAPRIKQVKVRNDSCIIHKYFSFAFLTCYGEFSKTAEDRKPFGLETGTAWLYHSQEETQSPSNTGKISVYDGGGYYLDLSLEMAKSKEQVKELKDNLWIRRSTRCVSINFAVYNGNLNLFSIIEFLFEFPPTGGILANSKFSTVKAIRYVSLANFMVLACEVLIAFFIIYFTIEECRDISYMKLEYLTEFWSYIDCSIVVLGYTMLGLSIFRYFKVHQILQQYHRNPYSYTNFEYTGDLMAVFNDCSACLLFLVYIKIFKFINFNRTMGQLNVTLSKCKVDVLGFSIMFAIIFIAFAALGYLLFGSEAEDFSEFFYSMLTLLRTILGDFDYREIERANSILAPVYFLLFIFLVFFVLLNMFLAIINDTYTDVKTEIALGPQELQMSEVVHSGYSNLLAKMGCRHLIQETKEEKNILKITFDEIKTALKICGFTDLETEMFFARYNIDPTAPSGEFDVRKLVEELEGKYKDPREIVKADDDAPTVKIHDFMQQQERLEEIEKTVNVLADSLQTLLQKLDNLETVRRTQIR